jgi:UDP-N-acetylmuramoyl-L-alanyl-D-glutamate--2,6-diaminopimelate ligase
MTPGTEIAALFARLAAFPRRICADSRQVEHGVAFAAYPGGRNDGRLFIADAIARGASAVLWESRGFNWDPRHVTPNTPIEGLQRKLGPICDFVYGSPSQDMWMVAVTGTNGKTSCAHWIAQSLNSVGRRTAILGTLGNGFVEALSPAMHTTPDPCALHELLAQFRRAGAGAVSMEVSSHGLDQGRVNGVAFDIALFTNLTRDHLDYHGTLAAYGQAKARLFTWPGLRTVVINSDDAFGQSLIDAARGRGQRMLTYGLSGADVSAASIAADPEGLALTVATPWGRGELRTRVVGAFNVSNLLGVLGVLLTSDVPLDAALAALSRVTPPPGRMQRLGGDAEPLVVVDYAHTPDALEKALDALRPLVRDGGELTCVFGCGGERDVGKRPLMGRIAASLANRVIVTSDNPRGEDPSEITSAIVRGIREASNRRWLIELDRATAIRQAISAAKPGDVVLIAGKGHETYQEAQGVRTPFADAAHARAALEEHR